MKRLFPYPFAVALAALALAPGAHAHHEDTATLGEITLGLKSAGLLPGSTGLRAPLGDAVPSQRTTAASAAGATADSPLRVYVLVVDGMLPTQIGTQTQTLASLKASGTWYQQARSVLPAETLPNHAAMMTGVIPQKNGIIANGFIRGNTNKEVMQTPELLQADTLTTRLERAYKGAIDTATVLSKEYLWGLFRGEFEGAGDSKPQRSADFNWDPRTAPGFVPYPSAHTVDQYTMDAFLAWVEAEKDSPRPQFAMVNLGDTDRSGHADAEGAAIAAADRAAHPQNDELSSTFASPFQQGAIEDADTQIGRLVTELKDSGAWDETVLIVLSDHGMDWGPPENIAETSTDNPPGALTKAGFTRSPYGGRTGDYHALNGGGSESIYVYRERDIPPMARALCEANGVAVVATRKPVPNLDTSKCRGKTHAELGVDHPYSPEIELFLEPGWRSSPSQADNPLPGNHGHGVTQHSTLMVTGGHPALDAPESIAGETVYHRGDLAAPAGPGVLSVAPTVAGLFGIGKPAGGYDAPALAEAFEPGTVDLKTTELVRTPPPGGAEYEELANGDGPAAPHVSVGSEVVDASLTHATYKLYVANHGTAAAEDVILSSVVPAKTTLASSSVSPNDPAACNPPPATTPCRWFVGDIGPGHSKTVEVTYNLAQDRASYTVTHILSAQVDAAAPNPKADAEDTEFDPTFTNKSLEWTYVVPDDASVDDAAAANTNYGTCNPLRVGNAVTAFLDTDASAIFGDERGDGFKSGIGKVWAAELRATVQSINSAGGAPVQLGAHSIVSSDWEEGSGACAGAAGTGRQARTGAAPESSEGPVSLTQATQPGARIAWDIAEAIDTRAERYNFNGFELRLGGASAADPIAAAALESGESTIAETPTTAIKPAFVWVTTARANESSRCVASDPEIATRKSDNGQRIRAYVTDMGSTTPARQSSGGEDVCNGMPVRGASVGWEIDDDKPDAYIASLAGHATERETGPHGDAAPNLGRTVTGPRGRTFIDVRLAEPYPDAAVGATRIAAISIEEDRDVQFVGTSQQYSAQGTCEPGEPGGSAANGGVCATQPGGAPPTGESGLEDDVRTDWQRAERPAENNGGGGGGGGGGPGTGRKPNAHPRTARVRIGKGPLRLGRKRYVRVRLICPRNRGGRCHGRLTIRYRGHRVGKHRYRLAAGNRRGIRLRIRKRPARRIRRHRTAHVRVAATDGRRGTARRRMRIVHSRIH